MTAFGLAKLVGTALTQALGALAAYRPSQQMIAAGRARPPIEHGMPELIPDLAPGLESLADLVVADRDQERHR